MAKANTTINNYIVLTPRDIKAYCYQLDKNQVVQLLAQLLTADMHTKKYIIELMFQFKKHYPETPDILTTLKNTWRSIN